MIKRKLLVAGGCTALGLLLCGEPVAQDRQVYRYTDADGRVVYSDRAPTSGAKDLSTKRIRGNTIETSEMPIALQQATERFPVTLYTFNCGATCDNAQALLNRRGVPFATVNVEEGDGAQKLQALTGESSAPVLQVGDKLVQKGFNEAALERDARPGRLSEIAGASHGAAGSSAHRADGRSARSGEERVGARRAPTASAYPK